MKGKTAGGILGVLLLVLTFLWGLSQQEAVMAQVEQKAADMASEVLGTKVAVGEIAVNSLHEVTIHDIALYDRQAECIARAESAEVHFRLLSVLQDPAAAVDEVIVRRAEANLTEREDGSWNFEDIKTESEGETSFRGTVRLEDSKVTGRLSGGQELALGQVNGQLAFSDPSNARFDVTADSRGASVAASGTISSGRQIVHVEAENTDIMEYLHLLPAGTLPEDITILSGQIPKASMDILNRAGVLSFSGQALYENGKVRVLDTEVQDIRGRVTFTDAEAVLSADAEANGQKAHAQGKIRWDTGTPYLDLTASSDSFAPEAVLKEIPVAGAASFEAHITGTVKAPVVDGTIKAASAVIYDIPIQNLSAHVRYAEDTVYADQLRAGIWNGRISGEAELQAKDLSYTAHIKTDGLDAADAAKYLPEAEEISGLISADLGLHGKGTELSELTVYGSLSAEQGRFRGIPVDRLNTSFFVKGDNITVDYMSIQMPNRSSIGMEGTIQNGRFLDLAFYGGHVDLSLFAHLLPQAALSGLSDFRGSVKGDAANPLVEMDFSSLRGTLFHQPYDSIKAKVSGSLDGIGIDTFQIEKDGRDVWLVMGSVGLTGEKRIDLRVDTIGARMEDIMALIAPDQPLTGNVDNTIRFTGTLDHPEMVGYIHFTRGSYRGILISGMDGDYFIEGDQIRLQDFHIYSPMVDMDVNGTINRLTTEMDMTVSVHDINMKRLRHKFPYETEGHGTFEGRIGGSLEAPWFDGVLDAGELIFNDVSMKSVHGHVRYDRGMLSLNDFGFRQGEGSYDVAASLNTETSALSGTVSVQDVEINELCALANQKNDLLQGKLSSIIKLGGTLENPSVYLTGNIQQGSFAGYDIHDISLDMNLMDRIVFFNRLSGRQGEEGFVDMKGNVSLDGPIKLSFSAQNLALGMFSSAAGIETQISGTADIEAEIGGFLANPYAEVEITAKNGGIRRSAFDILTGSFLLKNGLIDVKELVVQKTLAEQLYQASAKGIVPLRALTSDESDELAEYELIKLQIALDQADLSLLPVVSDYVEWALGATKGNLEITGTLAHPLVNGSLEIPDGSAKIKGVEKPIEDIQADIRFSGEQMTVKEFSGRMGKGTYHLQGGMRFPRLVLTDYEFSFSADRLDLQSNFYRGPLTMQFHFAEGEIYQHRMPKLSGQIDIDDCEVSIPSVPDSEGELPDFILDVGIHVGKDVHFYSPYLYDMYLSGDMHFGGTTGHPKSSGSVSVARGGTINYLKTQFNIREGEAHFDQVASFLPSVNFSADTKLPQATIYLSLKGPLDKMKFHLRSSPEMSETDIFQLLTFRTSSKTGQAHINAGDLLLVGLQIGFLSEVESAIRKSLFVDTFSISRGSGSAFDRHIDESKRNEDVYNVQIGKYVTDRVMLRYTQSFGGKNIHRYGAQYDLNDRVGFTLEREGNEYIAGVEARFKF